MLFSNIEGGATTSTVPRLQKRLASKTQVPFPDVIKMYNKGMGGDGTIDQMTAAYTY